MSEPLQAYYEEIRAVEDDWFQRLYIEGGSRVFGTSPWTDNLDLLREIDAKHGVKADDPRVYTIAAYKAECRTLDEEWRKQFRGNGWDECARRRMEIAEYEWSSLRNMARKAECGRRHFPGLEILDLADLARHVRYRFEMRKIAGEWEQRIKEKGWENINNWPPEPREISLAESKMWARVDDCNERHFPGLNPFNPDTIDTLPKAWAYITELQATVAERIHHLQPDPPGRRPETCDKNVQEVYAVLHQLKLPWAPSPPFPSFTQHEAQIELTRLANRLEQADAKRCKKQRRRDKHDAAGNQDGAGEDEGATRGKSGGGRKPLGQSNPLKLQVYQRIKREHQPGRQYADTIERLKRDKDFVEQVNKIGQKLDSKLVRAALAYFAQPKPPSAQETRN